MWFKKPSSLNQDQEAPAIPIVPKPPVKSGGELNILPRDNQSDVQETLARLKAVQPQITNTPTKQIKTASALVSESDYQEKRKRKLLIITLGTLAILTLAAIFASVIGIDQNRQIIRTGQTGVRFDGQEITVTTSEIDNLLTQLSTQAATESYFISFVPDPNSDQSGSEFRAEIFDQLGFEFGPSITEGVFGEPVLQYQRINNQSQFVLAFITSDLSNLRNGLRNWEGLSAGINQNLVTNISNNLQGANDITYSNLDYRVINDALAYTVDNAELALIGSTPELIESSRQRLRQQLLQVN